MNIAIIGQGAAGLIACSVLSKNHNVYVFDKNKSEGRKLLATGNGKANILNINANIDDYNNCFVSNAFDKVNAQKVLNYFNSLGLITTIDSEGRVYPYNKSSLSVLNVLLDNCSNASFIYDYEVNNITSSFDGYLINDYNVIFDKVIICSGSNASILENKRKSTYEYLKNMNLKLTPLKPSLVGFKVAENIKKLSGYRAKCMVSMNIDGAIFSELGEVIFKDDGISGIVIMNMSFIYNKFKDKKKATLNIDLYPNTDIEIINPKGIFHPIVLDYAKSMNKNLNELVHNLKLTIKDTYDFKFAQCVSGGISLDEVNSNFMLKKYKNIYACGEVLDIDARCGGYNLLFAFSSGLVVANTILENENKN